MATAADATRKSDASAEDAFQQLAREQIAPAEFFRRFLDLAVARLGAQAGEAWGLSKRGALERIANCGDVQWAPEASGAGVRTRRLEGVIRSGRPEIAAFGSQTAPRDACSALAPLHFQERCIGVVELAFGDDLAEDQLTERLTALCDLMEYARAFVLTLPQELPVDAQLRFLELLEAFSLRIHGVASVREIAMVAVNEARRVLGCDRVSIAMRRGGEVEVIAVSGQERVAKRSNLMRSMGRVAKQSLAARQTLQFSGDLRAVPPPVESVMAEYLSESGVRALSCVPLKLATPSDSSTGQEGAIAEEASRDAEPIGVFLVEQFGEVSVPQTRISQVSNHVALALNLASERESVFFYSARRWIGRSTRWAFGDGRHRVLFTAASVFLIITALAMIPAPHRVVARGQLMPGVQRRVFAPQDGQVVDLFVRDGQRVQVGQPLLKLQNNELALGLLSARNKLQERRQQLAALESQENSAGRNPSADEQIRLRGRIAQTMVEIESLQSQVTDWTARQEALVVRSSVAGVVTTFQPEQLLAGRPVNRGQMLLEVVDSSGPWQLELDMNANRLGRVLSAQRRQPDRPLPVRFVLSTSPETSYSARVVELATRATTGSDGASTVGLIARVVEVERPVVGADVVARIDCGQTNLANALFGDVIESIRRYVW